VVLVLVLVLSSALSNRRGPWVWYGVGSNGAPRCMWPRAGNCLWQR
jgi:hypothetical protein